MIRYLLLLLIPIAALAHEVTLRVDGKTVHAVALSNACLQIGWEAVQVTLTTDLNADSQSNCILERGRTYYLNATSHRRFNGDDLSCMTRQNCGFYFQREPS